MYLYHRPPIEKAAGIGDWQVVWEVMSIIGLVKSSLFFKITLEIVYKCFDFIL